MISPEKLFFTKLLRDQSLTSYTKIKTHGFSDKFFPEIYGPVLGYIDEYTIKHDQIPSEDEVREKFPNMANVLFAEETPKAALGAIYENLVREALRGNLHDSLQEVIESHNNENIDPFETLKLIQDRTTKLSGSFMLSNTEAATFAEAAPTLLDELEGKITQPLGAASSLLFMESQAKGWQPAELTTIAAPTGVGKTWMLALNAVSAASGNPYYFYNDAEIPQSCQRFSREEKIARRKRVLILSLEMPAMAVMRRLASLIAKISYARYRNNELNSPEREKLKSVLEYLGGDTAGSSFGANLKVIGPDVAHTPEAIHAAASDFGADIVMIDGFYLMPGPGEKRWEKVEANMQRLRLHSLESGRHYMLATQFRREAKTLNSTDIDSLSFSASIGHDSNNVFGLVQTKNDASQNIVNISVLKMRDGVPGQQYVYNWDHHECLYTEQGLVSDDDDDALSLFS